jgi:hypothetical protein
MWLLAAIAMAALWLAAASDEAEAQSCSMEVIPGTLDARPGPHTVVINAICTGGSSSPRPTYDELEATMPNPIRSVLFSADGMFSCPYAGVTLTCDLVPREIGGSDIFADVEFETPIDCPSSASASITLRQENSQIGPLPATTTGPCYGEVTISGEPKKCAPKKFDVHVDVPPALTQVFTGGEEPTEDEVGRPAFDVDLQRKNKKVKGTAVRYPGRFDSFDVKVLAKQLKPGKYTLLVHLTELAPEDYPNASAKFKVC